MGNDLRRRVRLLEDRNRRNSGSVITADEIEQAVERYEHDRGERYSHTPSSAAFRTMLGSMQADTARLFLHAHPMDLLA